MIAELRVLVLFFLTIRTIDSFKNNVCKTIDAYNTKLINHKECWYNPDVFSRTEAVIVRHGYPIETYQVSTDDGYILTVHRIPHNNIDKDKYRQPVFLQHGIFMSDFQWVDIGNRSLAFYLVEHGYDVWMGNSRGNSYSQAHVNLDHRFDDKKYWNFSVWQLGTSDLSAELGLVAKVTGEKRNIIYIGHSLGTTISYVYASVKKHEADQYLAGIVSLCPIAYFKYAKFINLIYPFIPLVAALTRTFHVYGLFIDYRFQRLYSKIFRLSSSIGIRASINELNIEYGKDEGQIHPEDYPVLYTSWPDSTSVEVGLNLVDFRRYGEPVARDYGPEKNLKLYGSKKPLFYNFSEINLPVHMFYGPNDAIGGDPKDVRHFYDILNTEKSMTQISEDGKIPFNHMDFIYAHDIIELLYVPLLKRMATLTGY